MSLSDTYERAFAALSLSPGADSSEIEKAYRRALDEHSRESDPESLSRIHDAYASLSNPKSFAERLLLQEESFIEPPPLPKLEPLPVGASAIAILRVLAGRMGREELALEPSEADHLAPIGRDLP